MCWGRLGLETSRPLFILLFVFLDVSAEVCGGV